ncbi:hypothetical protein VU03_02715, partial [Desulfobulbus sp. N3]|nr:hypothetical protein [Desulfobulbus sp. N3]
LLLLAFVLLFFSSHEYVYANEWVNDVQVTRLSAYQDKSTHYVWLSSGVVAECQAANSGNPTLLFSEKSEGGKTLMGMLMVAVITKQQIDVQVNGCEIMEVYLR